MYMVKVSTHACMHVYTIYIYKYEQKCNGSVRRKRSKLYQPTFCLQIQYGHGQLQLSRAHGLATSYLLPKSQIPVPYFCFVIIMLLSFLLPIQPSHDCATYMSPTEIPLALAPDRATCEAEVLAQSDCLAAWRGIPSPKENSLGKISKRSTITSCSADMMETKTTDIYIYTYT